MPLDIGAGILLSFFVAHLYQLPVTGGYIVFGILSALLPDIDFLWFFWKQHQTMRSESPEKLYDHRSLTHYPILWFPTIILLCLFIGPIWTTLFILSIFFHLAHDTVGLGWGIRWLWPFSTRSFRFFPAKDGRITSRFFMSWTKKEERAVFEEYKDDDWVTHFYLTPNIVAYVEYGVFLIAIIFLILYFR